MDRNKHFYALYNKEDECIGVFETIEEGIWKVYNIKKEENKEQYWKIYKNIHHSFSRKKNNYGNFYSYKGFWFKFPID